MSDDVSEFDPDVQSVVFDYIKGANFRAVHVDGAIGGPTPNGHVHMALFAERNAIPRRTKLALTDEGKLGDVLEIESRDSVVRELEFDAFLTPQAARSLHSWLGRQIEELEARNV